ncbi:16S rRNA (guanine(527)-N(7))-methyltransferase RsmG [Cohnella endophytica]|uniref:Ribosomal RNA small subunit methyltransferase G n=1 Tax=Cohnella endophytica TaxID=2419778 RepID=A0A494XNK2_9BACL|nr:16S rRNA (guanine(527)-N(7))-methyltransferase RsmG [Cohnella endophytica]RKP51311.1 16S rRNA (guanine(527)-N(7))-methyltransferase RsmG [Cohnella endophytica]
MTDTIRDNFTKQVGKLGIQLSEHQLQQFETYYALLIEWNEKMNLTGITEREAVYEKHFYDSLTLAEVVKFDEMSSLADIGSGAGFPSIPLAIAYPHLKVTIIDALAKRIGFLNEVTTRLGLTRVESLHSRAEDAARKREYRDQYDVVTARAVARLAVLNEFCLPYVRPDGTFIAMKGTDIGAEVDEARFSLAKLNGKISDVRRLALPTEGADRHLVVCVKKGPTPAAYPRKSGIPLKSPLVKPTTVATNSNS